MARRKVPKRLRAKVSRKISKLRHEGKPQDQAIAQGINQTLDEARKHAKTKRTSVHRKKKKSSR